MSKVPETIRRVGFLGTGYIADWHAKALKATGAARLAAVCDKNLPRARMFAAAHGVENAYGSLEEMLAGGGLSAVHVLLPPPAHFAAARNLIGAGVHVLLEKPMCTTTADCQALLDQAAGARVSLGVSHNFLFHPAYEQLRADVASGILGKIDQITVTWNKELPQISAGPVDSWLFAEPGNVILELGPHLVAAVLDLAGHAQDWSVRATNPITLANDHRCFRRWIAAAQCRSAAVTLQMSLVSGYTEHAVHVRGSMGSATADLEGNTYSRNLPTAMEDDFDRYARLRAQAKSLGRQARTNLWKFASSKFTSSAAGNFYGLSIAAALKAFYASIGAIPDSRIAVESGRDVIAGCQAIIDAANLPANDAPPPSHAAPRPSAGHAPRVLVLGGTGFIGRQLVRRLAARGPCRVLARDLGKLPADVDPAAIQAVRGDLMDSADLDRALDGIQVVYHLARANAKTWEEYEQFDIGMTGLVAQRALAAGVKRFIYTSTIDCYRRTNLSTTITEATPLDPAIERRNLYARAKAKAEEMLLELYRRDKLPLVIVRPGVVIGAGGTIYHPGVAMWKRNSVVKFWGPADHPLPLVLVDDVAAGLLACLDAPGIEGESFNLVADPGLTARQYVQELQQYAGVRFQNGVLPISQAYAGELLKWFIKVLVRHPGTRFPSYSEAAGRSQRAVFDNSKPKRMLGWRPTSDPSAVIRLGIHVPADQTFT